MKIDINKFDFEIIRKYRYVFFYGNYSNFIDSFQYFFIENYNTDIGDWKSAKNCDQTTYKRNTYTAAEFLKQNLQQEDLFADYINVNVITNVTDTNYIDVFSKSSLDSLSIYFFIAGDFRQTKKATDEAVSSKDILALPVFKNKATFAAILKKTVLNLSKYEYNYLSEICEQTNENIFLLISKVALLKSGSNTQLDIDTFRDENELFFMHMEPIPLARFLVASYLVDQNLSKIRALIGLKDDYKVNNILEKMLNVEINTKHSKDIRPEDILNPCFLNS